MGRKKITSCGGVCVDQVLAGRSVARAFDNGGRANAGVTQATRLYTIDCYVRSTHKHKTGSKTLAASRDFECSSLKALNI